MSNLQGKRKLNEDNQYHIKGIMDVVKKAIEQCAYSDDIHDLIDSLERLAMEFRADADLVDQFINNTIYDLENQAVKDRICPCCGGRLEEFLVSETIENEDEFGRVLKSTVIEENVLKCLDCDDYESEVYTVE